VTGRAKQNDHIRQRNQERAQLADEIRADAQELDLLVRRQAEQMAARELREVITPSQDPSEGLAPGAAQNATAAEMQRELAAANDSEEDANFGLARASRESEEQFQARCACHRARARTGAAAEARAPDARLHAQVLRCERARKRRKWMSWNQRLKCFSAGVHHRRQ
jgi:hypothetical protein